MQVKNRVSNKGMRDAKTLKDDEYYTRMIDIETELKNYDFKGKTVHCCCDDPRWSKFWEFFHVNFEKLGLKRLISTYFNNEEPVVKSVYDGGNDADISVRETTPLKGNGDYASEEVQEIMDAEADMVVTNPPFSLMRAFLARLHSLKKPFVIVAPLTALSYNVVFDPIKDGSLRVGYNEIKKFWRSDGTEARVSCVWLTTMAEDRYDIIDLKLKKPYYDANGKPFHDVEKRYPHYDTPKGVIDVYSLWDVPSDYMGFIGVPISFLTWYSPKQFRIICQITPKLKGRFTYQRVVIQRAEAYDEEKAQEFIASLQDANSDLLRGEARVKKTSKKASANAEFSIWD